MSVNAVLLGLSVWTVCFTSVNLIVGELFAHDKVRPTKYQGIRLAPLLKSTGAWYAGHRAAGSGMVRAGVVGLVLAVAIGALIVAGAPQAPAVALALAAVVVEVGGFVLAIRQAVRVARATA